MNSPPISGRIANALSVDEYDFLDNSIEVVRMWVENGGPATCLIQPDRLATPEMFGILMVDAVRHGARAFPQLTGSTESEMLDRIWAGLDDERDAPWTDLDTVQNYGKLS
jgi:hypothetical protein